MLKPAELERMKAHLLQEVSEGLDRRIAERPADQPLTIDEIESICLEVSENAATTLAKDLAEATNRCRDRAVKRIARSAH